MCALSNLDNIAAQPQTTPFYAICKAFNTSITVKAKNFKFGAYVTRSKSQLADDEPSLKGRGQGHVTQFLNFTRYEICSERLKLRTYNFVHLLAR